MGRANRMRVGWLTYGVDRPLSGISRQALELGRALGRREDCELVYLTPYRRGPFRREPNVRTFHLLGCRRLPALMLLGGLTIALAAQRHRLDVVRDPTGTAPFPLGRRIAPFRRVVTIHDAIAFHYPEGYPWLNTFLQRRYMPAMLSRVDAVITVSRQARLDLERFLPSLPLPVHVVPPALSGQFYPVSEADRRSTLSRLGLHRPYVLSVSAHQERKNLRRLIQAFGRLHARHPEHQLVLAGPTLWRYAPLWTEIEQADLTKHVILLGYVKDNDLAALYSGADLFAFPSLYEGFGLPILEAMACSTPVVCSQASSLPEAAGGAALLIDPINVDDLANGMARVLDDTALARRLRRQGLAQAQHFTWERAAAQTADVYRRILFGSAQSG